MPPERRADEEQAQRVPTGPTDQQHHEQRHRDNEPVEMHVSREAGDEAGEDQQPGRSATFANEHEVERDESHRDLHDLGSRVMALVDEDRGDRQQHRSDEPDPLAPQLTPHTVEGHQGDEAADQGDKAGDLGADVSDREGAGQGGQVDAAIDEVVDVEAGMVRKHRECKGPVLDERPRRLDVPAFIAPDEREHRKRGKPDQGICHQQRKSEDADRHERHSAGPEDPASEDDAVGSGR
jgi:hypothetical protein